ncbi:hypothetical protein [Ralstonia pseudosolanacearum]|uniref:hypothetical protein n=1 Tax=Ralstonia pseudosolanacearum TaxID=1310165 RepID=UPI003CEF9C39
MAGSDQCGALPGDEAALHRAAGLHQFGCQHHIHIARHGHEREHGGTRGGVGRAREQFDVVDRGAGALGDPGDRGRLGEVAVGLAQVDDPVREHAAAFSAHGEDGDLDGLNSHDGAPMVR